MQRMNYSSMTFTIVLESASLKYAVALHCVNDADKN